MLDAVLAAVGQGFWCVSNLNYEALFVYGLAQLAHAAQGPLLFVPGGSQMCLVRHTASC
jgi:hypothetical protein